MIRLISYTHSNQHRVSENKKQRNTFQKEKHKQPKNKTKCQERVSIKWNYFIVLIKISK